MDLVIRPAEPRDAAAIAGAHVAAWRVAYRGIVPDDYLDSATFSNARLTGWHARLDAGAEHYDPLDTVLVPECNGRAVGFGHVGLETPEAVVPPAEPQHGELYGFYLDPSVWGTGVAQALLDACTDQLRSRFSSASLFVLRDNPRARRFYERNGWAFDPTSEGTWDGPKMPGFGRLDLAEVQYHIALR